MAAGLGFKNFNTGDVLSAADVNGYLMQGVLVFASATARDAAITSPQEGQFAYTKDTNGLWYYDGATWVASGATGDIEGVTAGTGISGGGTSGTVTITNSMATAIDAKGDLIGGTGADTFARLAVGANNTVLTADSSTATGLKWAAGSSSGLTQIASVTISGASAWNTGTVFSSTYTNYKILMYGEGTGTNDAIYCFPRVGGTNNSSGGCSFGMDGRATDGSRIEIANTGQNYFLFPYYGTPGNLYDLTVSQPFATAKTFLVGNTLGTNNATAAFGTANHAGWTTQTTSYDSLGFTVSGGTFTGTMKIYGLAN
jgi:hypothetical protein